MLSVYFIVLGHNSLPHHHHERSFTDKCCQELSFQEQTDFHLEIFAEGTCHHDGEEHSPCHFEVEPVPSKAFLLDAVVLISSYVFEFEIPEEEPVEWGEVPLQKPKTISGPIYALRGPPAIA